MEEPMSDKRFDTIVLTKPQITGAGLRGKSIVEVRDLTDEEFNDLERDPTVAGFAPNLPFSLIKPTEKSTENPEVNPYSEPAADASMVEWGISAIEADNSGLSGAGITVAVLDTGVEVDHPAFSGTNIISENFTTESDKDLDGHGTHCAGTILGRDVVLGDTQIRMGVARGANLLNGKILSASGASFDTILRSIEWASSNGANVISMSLGLDYANQLAIYTSFGWDEQTAITKIIQDSVQAKAIFESMALLAANGVYGTKSLLVAATGNASARNLVPSRILSAGSPASADNIFAVGAVGQNAASYSIANFSNAGANVVAPGVGIRSAGLNKTLSTLSGTSMACPHTAGVACLTFENFLPAVGGDIKQIEVRSVANSIEGTAIGRRIPGVPASEAFAGLIVAP